MVIWAIERKKKTLALKDQEMLLKGNCNLSRMVREELKGHM